VRSYHSSRQFFSRSTMEASSHDMDRTAAVGSALQQYRPDKEPIKEDSREMLIRTITDAATQPPHQPSTFDDEVSEYLVRRQTLNELYDYSLITAQVAAATKDQHLDKLDEETLHRSDISSRSMMTTEFSRQFQFFDVQGDRSVEKVIEIHSAFSLDAMEHQESRADNILVETLPEEHQLKEPQDGRYEAEVLQQGADDLTRDAFNVAIQRVSTAVPIPLSEAAIRAAEVITLDILNRALRDDLKAGCCGSECGPDHIKLASTIVRRLMSSASSRGSKWSDTHVQAASLLVDDVLSSVHLHISRGDDVVATSNHLWSRDAIKVSCLIVREVLAEAQQAARAKQLARSRQQPTTQSQKAVSLDDLLELELAPVQAAKTTTEHQPRASQPTSGPVDDTAQQSVIPGDQQTSQLQQVSLDDRVDLEFAVDQPASVIIEHPPRTSQQITGPEDDETAQQLVKPREEQMSESQPQTADLETAADPQNITEQTPLAPKLTDSRPASRTPSSCCYTGDSFSDSSNHSQSSLL